MGIALQRAPGTRGPSPDASRAATVPQRAPFFGELVRRGQLVALFDFEGRNNRHTRNTLDNAAMYVGALLAVYMSARLALQYATAKYQQVSNLALWGAERLCDATRILTYAAPHKPCLCRRQSEFPQALQFFLGRNVSMSSLLAIMQLHPVLDDPTPFQDFAKHYDVKGRGFLRMMFVVGRLRRIGCLHYFRESGNMMESAQDLEDMKKNLDVDLSDIETTFELSTLPKDQYLRNSRVVEVFGTAEFEAYLADIWTCATSWCAPSELGPSWAIPEGPWRGSSRCESLAEAVHGASVVMMLDVVAMMFLTGNFFGRPPSSSDGHQNKKFKVEISEKIPITLVRCKVS